jgi:Formyl transferase
MRTALICHEDAALTRDGLARWLASFTELVGMVIIREGSGSRWRRLRREIRRSGLVGFLDVLAFRAHYALFHARHDRAFERERLEELRRRYPPVPDAVPRLYVSSPNLAEAEAFLRARAPDLVLARCKVLLRPEVFSIPPKGTFILHPGACPEYRNSHGCFWALARGERDKVAVTLLQIDRGVDTGPVYGYFTRPFDERRESHIVIQQRLVLETLPQIQEKLRQIAEGRAQPIDTSGRVSAAWGQPRLTSYWKSMRRARARAQ